MWGAIIAAAAGAAGGYLGNKEKQKKVNAALAGADKYRNGVDRLYGAEQDALIQDLATRGASESRARSDVANNELGRQLLERQSTGGAMGVRAAMMSGKEAELAGRLGEASGSEIVGSRSAASSNLSQAQRDALARRKAQIEALRLYNEANDARKSGFQAGVEGAGNGLMAYAGAK